jgi:hypothetical protein
MTQLKKLTNSIFVKILSSMFFVIAFGCSSEVDTLENSNQEKLNFILLHKNYDYLKSNVLLYNKLSNFDTQKLTSKSKNIKTTDFEIFTDKVTYAKRTDNSKESYTFYIEKYNHASNKTMDNLILSRDLDDVNFKAYIITYYFPDGIASEHKNFKITGFKEINSKTLSFNKPTSKPSCENTYEYVVTETAHACYSGNHSGASEAGSCDGKGSLPYSTYAIVVYLIDGCGEGGGSSSPGGGSGGPGGGGGSGSGGNPPVDTGMSLPPPCQSSVCEVQVLANDINDLLGNILNYEQLEFLLNNDDKAVAIKVFLDQNNSPEAKIFTEKLIEQMILNPYLQFDINASFKSPFNIDRSSIPYDLTKPENQKFNEVYNALKTSSEFQKLFIDIFDKNTRFNVKFEIADHVYDSKNKEVHATTSQDPVTKNIVIKVSKQILTADGTMSQTKIENAKTILHECIHAYLLTISSYPLVGMDIAEVINKVLPTPDEQHDFMYTKMIPTMQKVLGEIRDLVTTEPRRIDVSDLKIYTKIDQSAFEIWNWNNFYKSIILKGLEETNCYKEDFPKDSDGLFLWNQYINYGHARLDKN